MNNNAITGRLARRIGLPVEFRPDAIGNRAYFARIERLLMRSSWFVSAPLDHEAWTYAEAHLDLNHHVDEVKQALSRRGGVTTKQLLAKAKLAADEVARQ